MSKWMPIAPVRPLPGKTQALTIGSSAAQSSAFSVNTQMVMLSATGNCHVRIDTNPTATTSDMYVKSSDPPLLVRVGNTDLVSVIQDASATGTLFVTECTH